MYSDKSHPFDPPQPPPAAQTHLAEVVSVADPERRGRVQVRLSTVDGVTDQDAPIWALVSVPVAGPDYGTFMMPGVGDEVVVQFINSDPRRPLVVGSIWHGKAAPPESISGDAIESWTLVGRRGTRIAVDESQSGSVIRLTTVAGVDATLTDEGGGRITLSANGSTVEMTPSGIDIDSAGPVEISAATAKLTAGMVTVEAGMSKFNGVVQCDTLITTTCVATTYTPGAGNVW